jgi:hypothetical protein
VHLLLKLYKRLRSRRQQLRLVLPEHSLLYEVVSSEASYPLRCQSSGTSRPPPATFRARPAPRSVATGTT